MLGLGLGLGLGVCGLVNIPANKTDYIKTIQPLDNMFGK